MVVSVWYGGAGTGAHLFLTDVGPVHCAGGVIPAPYRHSLQHACFHNVATVLVDVVVRFADLPETKVGREKEIEKEFTALEK